MRNETDKPMIIEGDEDPLMPGYIRLYEFLHGYEDVPIAEYDTWEYDPATKILIEEIQKEINREVIKLICEKSKEAK